MNVQEFIKQYKTLGDNCISKHIVKNYVPWAQKTAEAREIINKTMYNEVNGNKIFWANTPFQFFWFMCRLIYLYTDIEMNYEDIANDYDALDELGLINKIVTAIPEAEYKECETILSMCANDEYTNIRSIPSYLDTKFEAILMAANSFINNEAIQEVIQKALEENK